MKKSLLMKTMLLLWALIVGSSSVWAETVTLWSEDFSSYSANAVPSGGTYNYVCGGANTKIYDEALAGGSKPELLLQKSSNGTFTATIPLDNIEGDLTLTFKTNNQKIKVETTTEGLTGGLEEKASGTHTATFKGVTTSTTSITITFTCTGSSNVRLDDILLTAGGGGDVQTTYIVTYDANGATSGTVPVDGKKYDSEKNTVTILGNTGNLAKDHYTFTGWNTVADGTGTGYVADDTFEISANTTLYAQWTVNTNTVTLPEADQYGDYTMSATNPVVYGTEVTLTYTPATGFENYKATWSVNGEELQANQFTMPDEAVTVTVSVEESTTSDMVVDFESDANTYSDWTFTNIVSNYTNSGVSAHGGSKYGSTNGKASGSIQTKEKVNPVSFTCYVSKQSTNTSASTWYVKVSSDGSTWTDAESSDAKDMSKGVWKEFTADLSTYSDVYVRVEYSGSTAVRLIDDLTLTVNGSSQPSQPQPSFTASDVNIAYNATSGSVDFELANGVKGGIVTATTEAEWLTLGTVDGTSVPFTTTVNEKATERTAVVTLTYTYNETETVTKDVTVTQAGNPNVVPTIAEARAQGTGSVTTKGVVTSCSGSTAYIQDAEAAICVYSNSSELTVTVGDEVKVEGTLSTYNGLLEITSPTVTVLSQNNTMTPEVMTIYQINESLNQGWLVKIENAKVTAIDGLNTTIAQDGNTIVARGITADIAVNDIITLTGNIGCYNVAQIANPTDVAVTGVTITLVEACHNSENIYYGTYSNANAFIVPDDLTVAEVGIYNESDKNKLTVETYKTGNIVPANTGVVVSSATAGAHVVLFSTGGTSVMSNSNCLRATGNEGITATAMDKADSDCVFYRLTMHEGTDLGFYWGAEDGAAFAVAANKAYLAVPKSAGARIQGFSFDGDTVTGISQIENEKSEVENYFDLQGRSIANPAKGLYIKNGKKVVIR